MIGRMSNFDRMRERYLAGAIPWDDTLPPPEVTELMPQLEAGRALDLGCGYGRATIFMARYGWRVDGVDFIPEAIAEATRRVEAAGVTNLVQLSVGYSVIYWTNALLAENAIDEVINPTQIGGPLIGPARPSYSLDDESYWVQALTFGVSGRF